ncbi:hypothetical protein [Thermococcus sp. JdF3]|uniref:hypothetical protein n=1 Tax=Thermococcus sp. JdF3 TaxID=1638258 RepID=UPI001F0F5AB1|nr:hypothetical protein [Thermococcus sp. JdF3]
MGRAISRALLNYLINGLGASTSLTRNLAYMAFPLVRGFVVQEKVREHVAATRALGAGDLHILRRHILKPVIPYALSHFSLLFPGWSRSWRYQFSGRHGSSLEFHKLFMVYF